MQFEALRDYDLELNVCSIDKIHELFRLITTTIESKESKVKKQLKKIVSKKKKRYNDEFFDLDLTYITDNIIAMGFPSERIEGLYRNHYDDVFRFFELKHFEHYKVYNLCSEKQYPLTKFNGQCANYPFDDHNPPSLKMLVAFCDDAAAFIEKHPDNVVAIHCKGGKGRTGTMVASLLIRLGFFRRS